MTVPVPRTALFSRTVTRPAAPSTRSRVAGGSGSWVAGGTAVLAVLASLAAIALHTSAATWGLPSAQDAPVDLAVGLAYPLMGALVVVHGRGSRGIGWLLLGAGFAAALAALTTAAALAADEATVAARAVAQLSSALWVPGFFPLMTLLPLSYPDGLLPGRVWRALQVASVVGICLFTVGVAVHPEPVVGQVRLEKLLVAPAVPSALLPVTLPLLLAGVAGGLTALVVRLRRSSGLQRRQVVVLLTAVALLALDVALQGVLPSPADVLSQAVAVALVPVAIGIAVTRHRLYDLDLAVCRALAGASLAVCLAGIYLTAFGILRALLADRTAVASALAAALTGLLGAAAGHAPVPRGRPALLRRPGRPLCRAVGVLGRRCASGWTSPRCRRPSATRSSRRCGWARPSWFSAPGARRRRARRPARAPRCRCATAVSAWARSRSPHDPVSGCWTNGTRSWWPPSPTPPHRRSPRSSSPTRCSRRGKRWWPPARRNDAGCAATSTTASVRRWPGSGCSWTRRAT